MAPKPPEKAVPPKKDVHPTPHDEHVHPSKTEDHAQHARTSLSWDAFVPQEKGTSKKPPAGKPPASHEVNKADKSTVTINDHGQVTKVVNAQKQSYTYEYEAGGKHQLKKVTSPQGTLTRKGEDTWLDEHNQEVKAKIWVNQDGNMHRQDEHGETVDSTSGVKAFRPKSGNRIEYTQPDNSKVVVNPAGKIIQTVDVHQKVRLYDYDGQGNLNWMKDDSGIWTSSNQKDWTSATGGKRSGFTMVDGQGNLVQQTDKEVVIQRLDGKTAFNQVAQEEVAGPGGQKQVKTVMYGYVKNEEGHIVETTDKKGQTYKFEYAKNGSVNKETGPDGVAWTTTDGFNWSSSKGPWQGKVEVDQEGNRHETDVADNHKIGHLDGSIEKREPNGRVTIDDKEVRRAVDQDEMDRLAESMRKATKLDNKFFDKTPDRQFILDKLQNLNEYERRYLRDAYARINNGNVLMQDLSSVLTPGDAERAFGLMKRKDDDNSEGFRIRSTIMDLAPGSGRSYKEIELDLRSRLAHKNADEIKALDDDYRKQYHQGLRDALMERPDISQPTKDMLDIYLKGTDKRTDQDRLQMANIALKAEDLPMFTEALQGAPATVRQQFMDNDGNNRMYAAFHHWHSSGDYNYAREIAEQGYYSTASQIRDNIGHITNNEVAIKQALTNMSPEERDAYRRVKEAQDKGATPDSKDFAIYKNLQDAMKDATGNEGKRAGWEDMVLHPGGALISKLGDHAGRFHFTNDSMDTVLNTVEGMNTQDFATLKTEKGYTNDVNKALSTFLNPDEAARVTQVVDKKIDDSKIDRSKMKPEEVETFLRGQQLVKSGADTTKMSQEDQNSVKAYLQKAFETSEQNGKRPVEDAINDKTEPRKVVDALINMTADERKKIQSDANYRKQITEQLRKKFGEGNEFQAALHVVETVQQGKDPKSDILVRLNLQAAETANLQAQAAAHQTGDAPPPPPPSGVPTIRDIRQAIKDDPKLLERYKTDRQFAQQIDGLIRKSIVRNEEQSDAFNLLRTGELPPSRLMQLNGGNQKDLLNDVLNATPQARESFLKDDQTRKQLTQALGPELSAVAFNALKQKEGMGAEDKVRAFVADGAVSKEEVLAMLGTLSAKQKDELKLAYARKYHGDAHYDLFNNVSKSDRDQLENLLKSPPKTSHEAFEDTLQQFLKSRGDGPGLVDYHWDGTGRQTDQAFANFRNAMAGASKNHQELSLTRANELRGAVVDNLRLYKESKESAADAAVDTAIGAVAIGGAFFTGGVSLNLLYATTALGAVGKVAFKKYSMGNDYDDSVRHITKDVLTGGVTSAVSFIGPGEVGALLKLGQATAKTATTITVEQFAQQGLKQVLRTEAEQTLQKGMTKLVQETLAHGSTEVSEKAFVKLANSMVKEGLSETERQAAVKTLTKTLQDSFKTAMQQESRTALKRTMTSVGLNSAGGGGGGGAGGFTESMMDWDFSKSDAENINHVLQRTLTGTLGGMAAGGGMTVGLKSLGLGFNLVGKGAGKSYRATYSAISNARNHFNSAISEGTENLSNVVAAATHNPETIVNPLSTIAHTEQPHINPNPESPAFVQASVGTADAPPVILPRPRTAGGAGIRPGDHTISPNGRAADGPVLEQHSRVSPEAGIPHSPEKHSVDFDNFTVQRRRELAARVENSIRQRDVPLTREHLQQLLDHFPKDSEERKIALEIMEQSAPNMNSRKVDQQMLRLKQQISDWNIGTISVQDENKNWVKVPRVTVYTLDGSSDGNMLAHIFQKNTGVHVWIEPLTGENLRALQQKFAKMEELQQNLKNVSSKLEQARAAGKKVDGLEKGLSAVNAAIETERNKLQADREISKVLFFDDLSKATPEQRQLLSKVHDLMLADMNGFSRGLNTIDTAVSRLAGPNSQVMEEKLADLVRQVSELQKKYPGLTGQDLQRKRQELVAQALRGDIPPDLQQNPTLRQYALDPSLSRQDIRNQVSLQEDYRVASVHNEAGEPLVSAQQVYDFLGFVNAEYERAKASGRVPLNQPPAEYENAVARALETGVHFNSYANMVDQAHRLHQNILAKLSMKDSEAGNLLIVTGFEKAKGGEKEGSQYLVNHLYAKANGLDSSNFISIEQLQALKAHPEEAQSLLKGKKLVFIDDYANTGQQQADLLKCFDREILTDLKDVNGRRLVNEFTVGSFGRHSLAVDQNPWITHGPGDHLQVHPVTADQYHDFFSARHQAFQYLKPYERLFESLGINTLLKSSSVKTTIVTPYGGPNNNLYWLQAFIENNLNLPQRFPGKEWQLFPEPQHPPLP